MYAGIEAVAFDIDGTLYPSWKLYFRAAPYFFKNIKFFYYFAKTREVMHRTAPLADFYEYQARVFAGLARCGSAEAKQQIDRIIYKGLARFFASIRPFPHVIECIKAMRDAGLRIGILSDFPIEQKGDVWGIQALCDVCIGSEGLGALKPSKYPFALLSQKLMVPPEKILYVGNSGKIDVSGANNAGMKSACILTGFKRLPGMRPPEADISFKNYRQLQEIVLK